LVPLLLVGLHARGAAGRLDAAPVRRRFALAREPMAWMATLLVVAFVAKEYVGDTAVLRERTFFGSYRVSATNGGERMMLTHGTTFHGWEELSGQWKGEPTSYYTRGGPVGDLFAAYDGTGLVDRVALVGMGVGTLAAYGEPGRRMDFYEIDPAVVDIARDRFGFLRQSEATVRVVLGDGRLSLARQPDASYGLIVLDAFSSDAIPAHLLTGEAVRTYRRKLIPGGLMAFHVTNRHLSLEPVLAAQAAELGMVALVRTDTFAALPASGSTWVVLARDDADLDRLRSRSGWERAREDGARAWTDDYSSLIQVLDVD
ncbi:MAG: spermidine synthase, partial [Actinomycetes bacterium]